MGLALLFSAWAFFVGDPFQSTLTVQRVSGSAFNVSWTLVSAN